MWSVAGAYGGGRGTALMAGSGSVLPDSALGVMGSIQAKSSDKKNATERTLNPLGIEPTPELTLSDLPNGTTTPPPMRSPTTSSPF